MRTRRLIVVTPEGERELLFIGRLTVGRAPECDISLADTKASRRHAEFDASGPLPRVTDLGSRNGILVNGRKVGAADLMPGDVVTVGDALIRFEERTVETVERPPAPVTDDRTAVLSPILPPAAAIPASVGAPAEPVASRGAGTGPGASMPPPMPGPAAADPDKTSVLPRHAAPVPPAAPAAAPSAPGAVADRPSLSALPRAAAPPVAGQTPATTGRVDAAPIAPPPVAPLRPSAGSPPSPVASTPPADLSDAPPHSPPAAVAASSPTPGTAARGSRFSWGGLVTLAAVVLGGLAVLLGALPLISASASARDALSQRQARTLAGWLAAGVHPQDTTVVDAGVLEAVLAQPGVAQAMVLDRATGRAVAPSSLGGRSFDELPGVGTDWKDVAAPVVGRGDAFVDAYVPAGRGAYVVWVRYERPSSDDTGLAVIVALVASLVLAMLAAMLIKWHTKATLQHFTRQVELAVSGASPKVMQGGLIPGLDRLPGVVTYLLERRAGSAMSHGAGAAGLLESDDPDLGPAPAVVDPGPPWLEISPSLQVIESSAHGPVSGAPGWPSARGRHLLDVLDGGPLRNAVVQGLGVLGMQAGAEATVPLDDAPPIVLRREPSGHVRVTLAAR